MLQYETNVVYRPYIVSVLVNKYDGDDGETEK